MRIINYIFIILVILLGVSFACLNAEPVTINYYLGQRSLPLSLLLVFVLGLGLVLGLLFTIFATLKVKSENRRLRGRIQLAEKEVENLRAIPLHDQH